MGKRKFEPFAEYAKLGHGIPVLSYWPARKTAHVSWHDGSLWHYPEFSAALDSEAMDKAIREVWERWKPQLNRRSMFTRGGVCGGMSFVPIDMAREVHEIVKAYFTAALEKIAVYANESVSERCARRYGRRGRALRAVLRIKLKAVNIP